MYASVLNSTEKARELVDIVRKQTNSPMQICIETVSTLLASLIRDLPIPSQRELLGVRNVIQEKNFIDINNCHDAQMLKRLLTDLTEIIDDKKQQSWRLQEDEVMLIEMLERFTSILMNAHPQVPLTQLSCDDFAFVQRLVALYQIDQRQNVCKAALRSLKACCQLNRGLLLYLLSSTLPALIVLNNNFVAPLSELEIVALGVLTTLFSTSEKPPYTHYEYFTAEFLGKMLSLIELHDGITMRFLLNFNFHFNEGENLVVDVLREKRSLIFGQLLVEEVNNNRNSEDLTAMKMMQDIFVTDPAVASMLFYDNDLKVLRDILCQDVLDTNNAQKITMILKVFEKIIAIESVERSGIADSLEMLLKSKDLSTEHEEMARKISADLKGEPSQLTASEYSV